MAKRVLKLKVRLPSYNSPRNAWRKAIHAEAQKAGIVYLKSDKLEIIVRLYLKGTALDIHDVDNRLKDILDALQGRVGGPKKIHNHEHVIPNDKQVYRVIIEKIAPPAQSHGFGHLLIRKYKPN